MDFTDLVPQNNTQTSQPSQQLPHKDGVLDFSDLVQGGGETGFVNQKDQETYNRKNQIYEGYNSDMANSGFGQQIASGVFRGVNNDLTGLRTLIAKGTNAIGLEDNLDPKSPNYNPLLDKNSATYKLFGEKMAKGQTGWEKAGKTAFDVGSFIVPGVAEEALATKGLSKAGTAAGLLGGTDAAGLKLAKAVVGEGKLGKYGEMGAKIAGNVIGGTLQTAVKNRGVVTPMDVALNTGLAAVLHGAPTQAIKDLTERFSDPKGWAFRAIQRDPGIAEKEVGRGVNILKDSIGENALDREYGLGDAAMQKKSGALDFLTKHFLPEISTNGKRLDANSAYQKSLDDLKQLGGYRDELYDLMPNKDIHAGDIAENMRTFLTEKDMRKSDFKDAVNIATGIIKKKLDAVGGIESGQMTMRDWSELASELGNKEFGLTQENPANSSLRQVLYAIRKAIGKTAENKALEAGRPEIADAVKAINERMSKTIDVQTLLGKIKKDPLAFGTMSRHLFSLSVQGVSHVPGSYAASEIASKLASKAYSKMKFGFIKGSPILEHLAEQEDNILKDKITAAIENHLKLPQ